MGASALGCRGGCCSEDQQCGRDTINMEILDECVCDCKTPQAALSKVALAVVRHSERLDVADPVEWKRHPDYAKYSFDCPLSANGHKMAREFAQRLLVGECHENFAMVIASPYVRCVETASHLCRILRLPLLIDRELGEVFGPTTHGPSWPASGPTLRTPEEIQAFVPTDVRWAGSSWILGREPRWPETLAQARIRMVSRVERYASRAVGLSSANFGAATFVLVTHGDCVAGCLALALAGSQVEGSISPPQLVQKIGFCGYCLLDRMATIGEEPLGIMDSEAGWRVRYGNIVVGTGAHGEKRGPLDPRDLLEEAEDLDTHRGLSVRGASRASSNAGADFSSPRLRKRSTLILESEVLRARAERLLEQQGYSE